MRARAERVLHWGGLAIVIASYLQGKEKKKVGRPIAYRGDPNAPELTDQERRRIKRRIANRESARRVRHKRQEELEDMQIKASATILSHSTRLVTVIVANMELHKGDAILTGTLTGAKCLDTSQVCL